MKAAIWDDIKIRKPEKTFIKRCKKDFDKGKWKETLKRKTGKRKHRDNVKGLHRNDKGGNGQVCICE